MKPHRQPPKSVPSLALGLLLAAVLPGAAVGETADPAAAATAAAAATIGPDELVRGQKGYGLTVLSGTEPVRFEAEVVGVMRNVAPDLSYILARLSGQGLEESGVAAGMSGSPVFFDGRLAGAVAFAWPFSREAIAGITPIGAMREIDAGGGGIPAVAAAAAPPVTLADLVAGRIPEDLLQRGLATWRPAVAGGATAGIPWSVAGFGEATRAVLAQSLGAVAPAGEALPAAGGLPRLTPGGAVAAVLVDGDLRLAATGTVTDVVGDRVFAFGHPFLALGSVEVPMAASEIVTVVASEYSSFKVANLGPVVGAFHFDRQAGIAGRMGVEAETLPMVLRVGVPRPREFRMRLARLPQVTPILLGIGALAGLESASHTNGLQGLDMTARFHLAGHDELVIEQSFDGAGAAAVSANFLMAFAGYLLQNDLAAVDIESVEVTLEQSAQPRTARLVGAHAERTVVRPGDEITLNLDYAAWRGDTFRHTVRLRLPEDAPKGTYYLFAGDGPSIDGARLLIERTQPVNIRQALELLGSLHSRRELMVLGVAAGQGLSVAGEVLPNLPGSVRSLWAAAPSGSATALPLAVVQQHAEAMPVPVEGLVRIDLTVERRDPLRSGGNEGAVPGEGGDAGPEGGGAEGPAGEGGSAAPAAEARPR
jgi:hypothetical protein